MQRILFGLFAALCLSLAASVHAQAWPTRPVKFIVPFTPGTGMDTIARIVAPRLAERLGQSVVVENRPGASGNIGTDAVAKAAPDGYTLMVGANTMLMAANLTRACPSIRSPISRRSRWPGGAR